MAKNLKKGVEEHPISIEKHVSNMHPSLISSTYKIQKSNKKKKNPLCTHKYVVEAYFITILTSLTHHLTIVEVSKKSVMENFCRNIVDDILVFEIKRLEPS